MAIVLALVIVGWLVAFALGNQAGFSNQPVAKKAAPAQASKVEQPAAAYREPASVA